MSRWGKNNVVVPLDTLINKEKENTNRPIAARSCGTVGRWGKMGFTSTRTYALKAIPSLSPGQSPELGTTPTGAGTGCTSSTGIVGGVGAGNSSPIIEPPVPKPKKFFKSRNTTAPLDLIRSQFMQHHMSHISHITNSAEIKSMNNHAPINNNYQPKEGAVVAPSGGLKIKIKKRNVERKKSTSVEILDKEKRKKDKSEKKKEKDEKKKEKIERKEKKKEEKKIKPETQPSRVLGRNRKPINYNEDDDSIPYQTATTTSSIITSTTPTSTITVPNKEEQQINVAPLPKTSDLISESTTDPFSNTLIISSPQSSSNTYNNKFPNGVANSSIAEHPPIVLRISKGTSRLVSTDSEDQQNSSPGHQENSDFSPPPPPSTKNQSNKVTISNKVGISAPLQSPNPSSPPNTTTEISTTEELLSVLSGEPTTVVTAKCNNNNNFSPLIEPISEINYAAKISPDKPPKERLKLIIKTDVLKKALAAERAEKAEKKKNKKHHHHHSHKKLTNSIDSDNKFKTPSPQPGNDNYDLYKQLTISPSDRDFDSQSSILGSISSKGTTTIGLSGSIPLVATAVPEDSCVIRSRGSSDITSDLETSQHSSLVAPPSDIESRLESMMDTEDDGGINNDNIVTGTNSSNINSVSNNKKDIKIKLKLTELEQPLQEDILEVLTGGGNEKENIVNDNKKITINKKKETKKPIEKETRKNISTGTSTQRVTRARRGVSAATVSDDLTTINLETAAEKNKIEIKKSPVRSRRAAVNMNKKIAITEITTEPIKEIQLDKLLEEPTKGKKGVAGRNTLAGEQKPSDISSVKETSTEVNIVAKRKRGQKVLISSSTAAENVEESVDEKFNSKETNKDIKIKEMKIKEIKSPEIKTLPSPSIRSKRGAAVKANAALANSPSKTINSSKESTTSTKLASPPPPKRGRPSKSSNNNNTKPLMENTSQCDTEISSSINSESSSVTPQLKSYQSRKRKTQPQLQNIAQFFDKTNESINDESTKSIDLPGTITPTTTLNESGSSINLTPQSNKVDSFTDIAPTSNTISSSASSSVTTDENSSPTKKEYKISKFKRAWYERDTKNNLENEKPQKIINRNQPEIDSTNNTRNSDDIDNNEPIIKKSTPKDKFINNSDSKLINKTNVHKINNINKNNTENDNPKSIRNIKTNNSKDQLNDEQKHDQDVQNSTGGNSVKLVISKKKGSIFKSRALIADQNAGTTGGIEKKRHIYKHTWNAKNPTETMEFDDEDENLLSKKNKIKNLQNVSNNSDTVQNSTVADSIFDDFNDDNDEDDDEDDNQPLISHKLNRIQKPINLYNDNTDQIIQSSVRCDKKAKEFYTVVRNVKAAHQIQEIGEYQEMDDDVEYILDALQPHNPISTRCLSALQLATKCMTPAFRMHVRAHGTVTKFFKALRDAKNDLSIGLCTAAIMFVLSQDTLNIDLDPDSLELMINLLEVDILTENHQKSDLAIYERNKIKVRELCEDIKGQGKATHLNLDTITVGTLAMETLLSLTSKKAGEWFKEELRELGGLEHIIKTICECCHQISDYVVSWTEILLDKLRTIERCLRVLENVSQLNETNQKYILLYKKGHAINTLFKLYKLCDSEIALYPTTDITPKDNPGVVLREALVPTLKVLINLTHPFNDKALGSSILGDRIGIFDTSFHILLQAPNYVPERCIFELSILVLLLLINLTMHTIPNRKLIMQSHAPSDFGNQFDKLPAIKALIEYFYRCEEQARLAEKNTDAILENPEKSKTHTQEEVDETVTKLLQKAGHHMEHTLQASYAAILIGHLISDNKDNEKVIRSYLRENKFSDIVSVLEKYYNFMNLTASSEATVVAHIKSTKNIIDNFKQCDSHSNNIDDSINSNSTNNRQEPTPSTSVSTRSTPRVYKTYSQR